MEENIMISHNGREIPIYIFVWCPPTSTQCLATLTVAIMISHEEKFLWEFISGAIPPPCRQVIQWGRTIKFPYV